MRALLLLLLACGGPEPEPPPPAAAVVEEAPQQAPDPVPEPPPPAERYAATHLLVAWAGAARAPEGISRSREEARVLAETLRSRAEAGEPLEDLARRHSDAPDGPRGGRLGVYLPGTLVPEVEEAVATIHPGELAPLVASPFGWHVLRRDPIEQARVAQVVVTRSPDPDADQTARARAEDAHARLKAGEAWEDIAAELSDVPDEARPALWAPGQTVPALESAAFALGAGELSQVVESPYGYHILRRVD